MNLLILHSACLIAAGLVSTGCQSGSSSTKRTTSMPTLADPLPAWTKSESQASGGRQVRITSKIIEITSAQRAGPAKPYRKRMGDSELQVYLRQLMHRKGCDIMTAPKVIAREGQVAKIEIVREFIYPLEAGEDPAMATENTGVTSYHLARSIDGGRVIRLSTLTDVSEFEGFAEVSPGFDQPVFERRRASATIDLADGETVVIGGIVTSGRQDVVDTTLGIFRQRSTEEFSRELIVIVTPEFVDPATAGVR